MKTFIFVYLALVLVNVLITVVAYVKDPEFYNGCDFGLFINLIAFLLWPVVWIEAIIRRILKG